MKAAIVVLLAAACSGGSPTVPRENGDEQPFSDWSIAGTTLSRRCVAVPDDSRCWVLGRDASGHELEGRALFVRAVAESGLSPDELARRAEDTLFSESGAEAVQPGGGPRMFVSPEEEALITTPRVEGRTLTYFRMEGEMHPTLERVQIDLSAGTLTRMTASELHARTAPALERVCEVWSVCGCEMGCRPFERVMGPDGERFRDAEGTLYFRISSAHPLRRVVEGACTESCPPGPMRMRCAMQDEACMQVER